MNLKNKHGFITGSGKRLGRAIAEALLRAGMNVSAHYHQSESKVLELESWSKAQRLGSVVPIKADLTQPEAISAAVEVSFKKLGPVDVLIHSASDFFPSPLLTSQLSQWNHLFDLNLRAPFFLTQECVRNMLPGSNILFIADVHGTKPLKNYSPYCATKSGLISLSRNLAKELAPNIRVNSISPGTLLPPDHCSDEQRESAKNRSLFKKVGAPEDLVHGVLFLLSHDYITGFDLVIDGGRSLV
jgi:pteridine reductase